MYEACYHLLMNIPQRLNLFLVGFRDLRDFGARILGVILIMVWLVQTNDLAKSRIIDCRGIIMGSCDWLLSL